MPGDRRKLLVNDTIADRPTHDRAHDATWLRTTIVRAASATCTPCWLITSVSTTSSVIAPPFLSVTLVTRGLNVSVSPTTIGARYVNCCSPCRTRARSIPSAVRYSNGSAASIISRQNRYVGGAGTA